jgi:phosphoglycolate phosphatase-like HAD superfamily hydrolase
MNENASRRLVLFDVDGTLLDTQGAGRRAFHAALMDIFRTTGPIDSYRFCGRTDPEIARYLLTAAGVSEDQLVSDLPRLWNQYLANLEVELQSKQPRVCPGVHELLDRIDADGERLALGLLTGNIERGARLKIESAGIEYSRFRLGAFGSDHEIRDQLPAVAVARAEAKIGHVFAGKAVVIVGDTPADIACGAQLGARSIAVATGLFTNEQLAACEPDFLFETLEDTEAVVRAITEEPGD